MKFRRFFYLGGAFVLLLVKFAIDVIRKNVELQAGGLLLLREIAVVGAFLLVFLAIDTFLAARQDNPVRRLGTLLLLTLMVLVGFVLFDRVPVDGFDAKELALIPLDYPTLFVGSLISIVAGVFTLVTLRFLRDLVLVLRKKATKRNFLLFVILMLVTAATVLLARPLDRSTLTDVLFGLTISVAVMNAFRLPWIVYLTKREKIITLTFGFLLFVLFALLNVILSQSTFFSRAILYYSAPMEKVISLTLIFGNIYFGMTFVSTLFHLPTAEAFDRKRSEVTSIHTLSKLVTQVFDFNELVETVTTMTLQVCEARSCWLELLPLEETDRPLEGMGQAQAPQVVAMKNIGKAEIESLLRAGLHSLRSEVLRTRKPAVVDSLAADPRFAGTKGSDQASGSLVVMPLVSHVGPVGFLYATKAGEFGFMKDDVDLISTFADQATIAIENSRLIKKSIERERLVGEMTLAQEMQRKLLPQTVPSHASMEIDALSTPAFEVGGDYYDFVSLPGERIGIIVGDVSGKGIPAAFYMAEVKGIFQSLSSLYGSPREFMIRANTVLAESIDKHSFVSLIYGILDLTTGRLILARAGHCPMLYVGDGGASYLRPDGMGLGLGKEPVFSDAIEEQTIDLHPGDLCLFYTDGITEAHVNGEEFGYERLLETARKAWGNSASAVKNEVLHAVDEFIDHGQPHDDLTLVVLRWQGVTTDNDSRLVTGRMHS
jgi:phosphoserine phosphatase RsbU/P